MQRRGPRLRVAQHRGALQIDYGRFVRSWLQNAAVVYARKKAAVARGS